MNINHPLPILATELDWAAIESSLSGYFSHTCRPSVPIRSILGMLILKRMFNESDESVVSRWVENPYWQHFIRGDAFPKESFGVARARVAVTDRGFRGKSKVVDTQIVIPDSPAKIKQQTAYQKRKARKRFIRRSPLEEAERV